MDKQTEWVMEYMFISQNKDLEKDMWFQKSRNLRWKMVSGIFTQKIKLVWYLHASCLDKICFMLEFWRLASNTCSCTVQCYYHTINIYLLFREIVDTYKFIDRTKICVWGWSFGGYLTTKILALDGENSIMQVTCRL